MPDDEHDHVAKVTCAKRRDAELRKAAREFEAEVERKAELERKRNRPIKIRTFEIE